MWQAPFVVALPGSGLVATAPPRSGQDEIRQLGFRPYEAGWQPTHLGGRQGNQVFIRASVARLGNIGVFYLAGIPDTGVLNVYRLWARAGDFSPALAFWWAASTLGVAGTGC